MPTFGQHEEELNGDSNDDRSHQNTDDENAVRAGRRTLVSSDDFQFRSIVATPRRTPDLRRPNAPRVTCAGCGQVTTETVVPRQVDVLSEQVLHARCSHAYWLVIVSRYPGRRRSFEAALLAGVDVDDADDDAGTVLLDRTSSHAIQGRCTGRERVRGVEATPPLAAARLRRETSGTLVADDAAIVRRHGRVLGRVLSSPLVKS